METSLDLYRASREELIALVVRQREQIAHLEQRLAHQDAEMATLRAEVSRLTERVGTLLGALAGPEGDDPTPRPTSMPGLKPAPRRSSAPPAQQKRRARGYGRRRLRP